MKTLTVIDKNLIIKYEGLTDLISQLKDKIGRAHV